jgi:predicted ATPase
LEALTAQLEVLSQLRPVLLVFEDAHWVDPTSLEVLGRTVDRLRTLGVLLIVTYRPEFEPPWIGRPYVTALTLNRLGEREIAGMIDRVMGNKALPRVLGERTDGIPLLVEEITDLTGGGNRKRGTKDCCHRSVRRSQKFRPSHDCDQDRCSRPRRCRD